MARKVTAAGPVEEPWTLPDEWRWERLGDVADRIADKHKPDSTSVLPFVGMDAIAPRSMVVSATQPFGQLRSAASAFEKGDILYGRLRPYLNKVWCASYAGACSGELLVIRPSVAVDAQYLAFLLHSDAFVEFASHAVAGDRPRIDFGTMAAFPVPIPPIGVQGSIVARINKLFAEIDDGEAALARARDDLATWRRTLLKAAVTGELTADWRAANPSVERGEDLLAQILAERRQRAEARSAARPEPAFPTHDGAAYGRSPLPQGWVWARIGDLFDVFVGATPSRSDSSLWNGDVPWVSSGEVGFCRISDTREKISRTALRGSAGRLHPPGTVMLGMIGEGKTRGQAAILDIEAAHNQNCASIRVSQTSIPPEYIYLVLAEQYERTRLSSSGGNQPALNKERVKAICIPLPDASECRAIATIYDEASDAIDALEAERVLIHSSIATLRQSILAAAFRGELA